MAQPNLLLAAVAPKCFAVLEKDLEHVSFELKKVLHERGREITHVYFPTDGVVSMVNEPQPGEVVEIATIGREGMVAVPVVLGGTAMPSLAFVQVPGEGFRMSSSSKAFVQALKARRRFSRSYASLRPGLVESGCPKGIL